MTQLATSPVPVSTASTISPLVIADRLITLAQDADRAGMVGAANRLIDLAYAVFDERAPTPRRVN